MQVIRVKDAQEGGKKAFEILEALVNEGQIQVMGLATGSTPLTLYEEMVKSDLDFSDMISINLDEYIGLDEDHPQSYHYFMKENLLDAKPFKESYVPDGNKDEVEACAEYDAILDRYPLDLQILGIGENGHVGFNEPGTPFDTTTHKAVLTESTIQANSRFFDDFEDVPKEAITMGIGSIMEAKTVILLAYGENKASAIQKVVEGPVTTEIPATILQEHPETYVIIDEAAASLLKNEMQ